MTQLEINKANFKDVRISNLDDLSIQEGEIVVRIERFAFTANNITYAVLGEQFKYWDFFPGTDGWGVIPVWGYASVVNSKVGSLAIGDIIYGYFPMASHLVMQVEKDTPYGFVDGKAHRKPLPKVYNYYEKIGTSPQYSKELENVYALFQPLFATSFLLAEFLFEKEYFNAKEVYITSASSKTAIALAHLIKKRENNLKLIAMTSSSNVSFVQQLSCYDEVYSYDSISDLDLDEVSCMLVDFSGNQSLVVEIQNKLMENLQYCSVVGLSHWEDFGSFKKYPFKSDLFFAPDHAVARQKEWGPIVFKQKLDALLYEFLVWSQEWIKVDEVIGKENIVKKYQAALEGKFSPSKGIIMRFEK